MRRLFLSPLLAAVCLLVACGREGPPDVLLVTLDTLRPDHLGAYGYARPTSPFIDSLAAEGLVFDVAYAPMGTTGPSHATLFTSRSPLAHRVVRNGLPLHDDELTLAERLSVAGYDTAAFVSSFPVSRRFGFGQGFDHFDDDFSAGVATVPMKEWEGVTVDGRFDRRAHITKHAVVDWLDRRTSTAPLFMWVHLFDPHDPYLPPKRLRDRFVEPDASAGERLIARYDAEILHVDEQLGEIVAAFESRSARGSPLIIITGDHGEGHDEHGWGTHNWNPYEEEVRVPLVVKFEDVVEAGERSARPVHLGDILPTIAKVVGLPMDASPGEGRSLLGAAPGRNDERPIFTMRPEYEGGRPALGQRGSGRAVRWGRWKYFEAPDDPRHELYDLIADPEERENLVTVHDAERRRMARVLREWSSAQERITPDRVLVVPEDTRAGLEALGYVEDGGSRDGE